MRTLAVNALRMIGRRTAIGRHLEYLAAHWSTHETPFDRIVFMTPAPVRMEGLGTSTRVEFESFGDGLPRLLWEQAALPRRAAGAAVLFSEYTCPLLRRGPVVVANHGIYEAVPEAFSRWQRFRATAVNKRSARHATRVIANSQSTRQDVARYFGVPDARIDVVYPGPADLFFESHDPASIAAVVREAIGREAPYVIFVGKLARRRHVPNLIEAFAAVRRRHDLPHHLLIVGPNVNDLAIAELAGANGVADAVTHHPHMEQEPLAKLYAGAELYVLPSTYEGISWTMFEAMASRTAVLTVEHPALREGAAGAVHVLPDPTVESLERGLTELLLDDARRADYEARGQERAREFSLARSADATMEILDRVAPASDPR
jgi:glycosyltransferase involved in cell wall biosynthesis